VPNSFNKFVYKTKKFLTTKKPKFLETSFLKKADNTTVKANVLSTKFSTKANSINYEIIRIVQTRDLDRELESSYNLSIICTPISNSSKIIRIKVLDVNDNTPRFDQSSLKSVKTSCADLGDVLMKVRATDLDEGLNSNLTFFHVPGTEKISFNNHKSPVGCPDSVDILPNGEVLAIRKLNFNVNISFKVTVKDCRGKPYGNRNTAAIEVSILCKNRNSLKQVDDYYPEADATCYGVFDSDSSTNISWWIILLIVIFSITIIASVVVIWFKRNSCTKLIRYHVHQNNSEILLNDNVNENEQV